MNTNLLLMLSILALTPCISVAKPANYDECILENISKAQTNAGVGAVRSACRSLFPAPTKEPKVVPIPLKTESKEIFLTRVKVEWNGARFEAELVNPSEYLVSKISYRYKAVDCASPTRAAVVMAQKTLNKKGFKAGSVDGRLGPSTRNAIEKFQKTQFRLKVTKKLDDATLRALDINTEIGWKSAFSDIYSYDYIWAGQSGEFQFSISDTGINCGYFKGWAEVPLAK